MSIWGREFWRSYGIALRRSNKDKRARSFALKTSFVLAYALAYVLYLCFLEVSTIGLQSAPWLIAFYGFIFGAGAIACILLRRAYRRQDELLSFSLTAPPRTVPQEADRVSPRIRAFLEERALIVGSLLTRAGSEIYLDHHELPPGSEVTTRQTQNALLRQHGLWDKLEPDEAVLARAPDGVWTVEQQSAVTQWCEQLRLLRWTLGIDAELKPLAAFPKVDMSLSHGLPDPHVGFPGSRRTLMSSDLRVERDMAFAYTLRVIAELKSRALITSDPELERWADPLRDEYLGDSTDYLAGSITIGELNDQDLRLLGAIATARQQYAGYLVEQLSSETPLSFAESNGPRMNTNEHE
jgi:hypothetical protein